MARPAVHGLIIALLFVTFGRLSASAQTQAGRVGDVLFPTSGAPEARALFDAGLSWLHSFEYEQALSSFQEARRIDPAFAMAYWGEAMCYQQFLWGNEDVAAARRILSELGATPTARGSRAGTPRERSWILSLDALFGDGDRPSRLAAYAEAMRQAAESDASDIEAAVFRGLAVLATASRGLAGAHHPEPLALPPLADSEQQRVAAGIFSEVLRKKPRHPGALHYLIHAYDDPAHAESALDAARVYAEVAPESSHARHMPAHVFLQLGRWGDAAASDEAAFAASTAMVSRTKRPDTMRDYHALSWLVYEYVQLGRFGEARKALQALATVADASKIPSLLSLAATLRARLAVESGTWSDVAGPGYVNYDELFAVGVGAVKRGEPGLGELARQRLTDMAASDRYRDRRPLLEIMSAVLSAELRAASGDRAGAIALMRQAVAIEGGLPPAIGPPALVKPSFEFFGELLLANGEPTLADAQFAASLERARNRSAAHLGRARAAARAGDQGAARDRYQQFLANWRDADADRPEVAEARAALAASPRPAWLAWGIWSFLSAGVVVAVAVVIARRRRPSPTRGNRQQRRPRTRRPASS